MHGWPSLAIPSLSLKSDEFPRRFEGAVDFDRIFTGAGRVPAVSVRGHLGPSLSKSMPPHEPSPAIVMYTIPLPCGTYVYSLK